ncbi:type III secretion protein [Vibrio ostreicida]|uniref:Type III secretion protein n=1 Tax=Vibrio ostreicida TaxID=526588 RepID=A0ABT8BSB1_9VIBR|nr:type III secretion protein [Vibrio ostreicida]MDN3610022.1 type III secretion protein [Vibrio ostreicida]MDN3611190.1 type III secretion protein [Vibrio ostreicida]NPD10447.1 type III secretion protein [Vibrio ostreicida]
MNPFSISITHCELQKSSDVVPNTVIDSMLRAKKSESKARQRIAATIRKARVQRDQAHHSAAEIIQKAQLHAKQLEDEWREQAQKQAVAETLTWMVNEANLERSLIESLKGRISQQVRRVIEQWATDQDMSQFLVKRLSDQIAYQSGKGALKLHVSRAHFQTMKDSFGDNMEVELKEELASSQAELSSNSVVIRLDLEQHLQSLLDSFSCKHDQQSLA